MGRRVEFADPGVDGEPEVACGVGDEQGGGRCRAGQGELGDGPGDRVEPADGAVAGVGEVEILSGPATRPLMLMPENCVMTVSPMARVDGTKTPMAPV